MSWRSDRFSWLEIAIVVLLLVAFVLSGYAIYLTAKTNL